MIDLLCRIYYPGSEQWSVELDRGSVTPGTDVLLMSTWDTEAQKWTFAEVAGHIHTPDEQDHAKQYYNDLFFPTSTSGWITGRAKAGGELTWILTKVSRMLNALPSHSAVLPCTVSSKSSDAALVVEANSTRAIHRQ